jgi:hypothetical protein
VTDAPQEEAAKPESDARPPQEMRLRPRRAPVMRLSRSALVGLGIVAATGISVALFFALQPQRRTNGPELYNTDNRSTPDGLANLPHNYGELPRSVPQLGPPLPGDLGRPILNAGAPAPPMSMSTSSNAEEQRTAQEQAGSPPALVKVPSCDRREGVSESAKAPWSTRAPSLRSDPIKGAEGVPIDDRDDLGPNGPSARCCHFAFKTAATTRSRRSIEYGLAIHARVLPTGPIEYADSVIPIWFSANSSCPSQRGARLISVGVRIRDLRPPVPMEVFL